MEDVEGDVGNRGKERKIKRQGRKRGRVLDSGHGYAEK